MARPTFFLRSNRLIDTNSARRVRDGCSAASTDAGTEAEAVSLGARQREERSTMSASEQTQKIENCWPEKIQHIFFACTEDGDEEKRR
jgi:hypothetical protein